MSPSTPSRSLHTLALLLAGVLAGCYSAPPLGTDTAGAAEGLRQGKELHARGAAFHASALERLARACAAPGTCREAIPYAADGFKTLGQVEAAADFFGEVAARHPEVAGPARAYRGYFLEQAGALAEALSELEAAVEAEPTPQACRWLGALRLKTGDRAGGVRALRQGLELDARDVSAMFLLARALRVDGRGDEAEELLRELLSIRLDHGGAWVQLGLIRQERGDAEAARTAFVRAIEVDERNIEARFLLARAALRERRTGEFERLLEEIHRIESGG
jgi:tetratricopeptide (TPR) repeat protein